jgi:sensory rhodopsin
MDLLVLATQYTFWIGFVGMAAATLYFLLERGDLKAEYRSTATLAALVTFVAAVHYYYMKGEVGTDGMLASLSNFPTEIRYIDWIITTPLLLIKFPNLLGLKSGAGSLITKLIVADLIMIIFGYLGETDINNAGGYTTYGLITFIIACIAWLYIIYLLFTTVTNAAKDKPPAIQNGLRIMSYFILIGWAIYPLGYAVTLIGTGDQLGVIRELVYNFADLVNKVGFALVALAAVKQMSKA